MAGKPETRGLAREAIGSARLTAFGVSNVARPAPWQADW